MLTCAILHGEYQKCVCSRRHRLALDPLDEAVGTLFIELESGDNYFETTTHLHFGVEANYSVLNVIQRQLKLYFKLRESPAIFNSFLR